MSKMNFEGASEMLKAMGHPIRLQILVGLNKGNECNVNTIVENLKVPQSTISQHLKILKGSGIISFRKEGVRTCYRIISDCARDLIKVLEHV